MALVAWQLVILPRKDKIKKRRSRPRQETCSSVVSREWAEADKPADKTGASRQGKQTQLRLVS